MMKKREIMAAMLGVAFALSACGSSGGGEAAPVEAEDAAVAQEADVVPEVATDPGAQEEAAGSEAKEVAPAADGTVSCGMFSIRLPEELAGKYVAEAADQSIFIYDKEARDASYGGFAFRVSLYANPGDYAGGIDKKVGEYTAADGTLYDVVMEYPTDVQYNVEIYQDKMPETYERLYKGAEDIVRDSLAGADGGSLAWGAGTKGESLYGEVLEKHRTALAEGWDTERLEAEGMSTVYAMLGQAGEGDVLDRVGYAYVDVNGDGIDELLVGEIAEGEWKGVAYDIYTMVDRKPAHVASGGERNRYYAQEYGMLWNEYSDGADASGCGTYDIIPNTAELYPQVLFKYDAAENEKQPWFISYGPEVSWENVTETDYEERMKGMGEIRRLDYTPFSSWKK